MVALAVVPTLLLAGCRTPKRGGPVEIVYWTGWSGFELDLQRKMVDDFSAAHPDMHVRILRVFGSYEKVRIAFAGGDVPDVCSAVWSDELAGYATRGALTPMEGHITASARHADERVPGAWKMYQ